MTPTEDTLNPIVVRQMSPGGRHPEVGLVLPRPWSFDGRPQALGRKTTFPPHPTWSMKPYGPYIQGLGHTLAWARRNRPISFIDREGGPMWSPLVPCTPRPRPGERAARWRCGRACDLHGARPATPWPVPLPMQDMRRPHDEFLFRPPLPLPQFRAGRFPQRDASHRHLAS